MLKGTFFVAKNQKDPVCMVDVWQQNEDGSNVEMWGLLHCDFFNDLTDGIFSKIQDSDDSGVECVIVTAKRYEELLGIERKQAL